MAASAESSNSASGISSDPVAKSCAWTADKGPTSLPEGDSTFSEPGTGTARDAGLAASSAQTAAMQSTAAMAETDVLRFIFFLRFSRLALVCDMRAHVTA